MQRMHNAEARYGKNAPILAFSDLVVVDANNHVIAPSFLRFIGRNPHRTQLNELLAQNLVTGCASAMNTALLNVIQSWDPENANRMIMHDLVLRPHRSHVGACGICGRSNREL